jgi:hypothetical protein
MRNKIGLSRIHTKTSKTVHLLGKPGDLLFVLLPFVETFVGVGFVSIQLDDSF